MFSEDFLGRFEGKVAVLKDGTKDNLDYTAVDARNDHFLPIMPQSRRCKTTASEL